MSEQPTDAEQDTAREIEWSEGVEAYIRALPWSSDATDEVKTLVAGNIRAYAAHVRSALAQLTTERDHWRAEAERERELGRPVTDAEWRAIDADVLRVANWSDLDAHDRGVEA